MNLDINVVRSHDVKARIVQNMLDTGLAAAEVLEGVRLTHDEYLALVALAKRAVHGSLVAA